MLTIRKAQIAAMSPALGDAFQEHLLEHLAAEHPVQIEQLGAPGARDLVRRAIDAGLAHGVESLSALATLATLMVEFGEGFEISPDHVVARQILEHAGLPGGLKMQVLEEHLRVRTGGRKIVPARRS